MPITHKPSPAQVIALIGNLPDFPSDLPREVTDRFPALSQWAGSVAKWWQNFSDLMQRDRQQVMAQFQKDDADEAIAEAAVQSSITALTVQVARLNAQIAAISNAGGSAQVAALTSQVATLTSALSSHIASIVTHGTLSPIVGQQDTEPLDSKTIGKVTPGYGRFSPPAIGVQSIAAGQQVVIEPGEAMIVVGPFSVSGSLTVAGTLFVL